MRGLQPQVPLGLLFTYVPVPPAVLVPQATYQLQWPATNPKRLAPRFVPLAEAETGARGGQGTGAADVCWLAGLHAGWGGTPDGAITAAGVDQHSVVLQQQACLCLPTLTVAALPTHCARCAAIGTGAGNPDFRLKRTEEDGEDEVAAAAPAPAAAAPKAASEGKEAAAPVVDRRCGAATAVVVWCGAAAAAGVTRTPNCHAVLTCVLPPCRQVTARLAATRCCVCQPPPILFLALPFGPPCFFSPTLQHARMEPQPPQPLPAAGGCARPSGHAEPQAQRRPQHRRARSSGGGCRRPLAGRQRAGGSDAASWPGPRGGAAG